MYEGTPSPVDLQESIQFNGAMEIHIDQASGSLCRVN